MSCHCHDCHENDKNKNECCNNKHREKRFPVFVRLILGAVLFLTAVISGIEALFFAAYLILGYDVLIDAVRDIKNIFNESFLMSIATIGALIIGKYPEAVAVMLFYQIGEMLSDYAVDKSKENIGKLMDLRSDSACALRNGGFISVPCEEVSVDDIIQVSSGEKIPLDGVIVKGSAYLDTSALTGEAVPVSVTEGDEVMSGSINTNSVIEIKVTKIYSESTASKILELVQANKKSSSERFITRFSRIYTPIVVILALLIGIIPSVLTGDWYRWMYTAMTFLVVSCPCALVVSVPLTFFAGLGRASKSGILIKGSNSLEQLAQIKTVAFDKTGTLTEGRFEVVRISAAGIKAQVLEYAAYAESFSSHPIARAIVCAYGKAVDRLRITDYREIAGKGVLAVIDGHKVCVGSAAFTCAESVEENAVYISIDDKFAGYIIVDDKIKASAKETVAELKNLGISSVMLTGDSEQNAKHVADEIAIPYYAGLLPRDKVEKFKEWRGKTKAAFIGDGINDAPVLSCADLGISMGNIGTDAAIESADAVIMSDDIEKIPVAVRLARRTILLLRENVVFAVSVKVLIMILGIFGIASMWLAVFADVGVCLLVILNALRAFFDKR
ncbi:MAG: heavy metal translocating P-type ATPase [Clostridiales bacterium]|nr:heavy metal translocating P-type ATPase [Clostridiales bacterium]